MENRIICRRATLIAALIVVATTGAYAQQGKGQSKKLGKQAENKLEEPISAIDKDVYKGQDKLEKTNEKAIEAKKNRNEQADKAQKSRIEWKPNDKKDRDEDGVKAKNSGSDKSNRGGGEKQDTVKTNEGKGKNDKEFGQKTAEGARNKTREKAIEVETRAERAVQAQSEARVKIEAAKQRLE